MLRYTFVELIVFSKSMGSLLSKWSPDDVSWVWLISLCLLQLSSVGCNTTCITLQPTCSVWIERLMTSWQCKQVWTGSRALCWSLGAHNRVELGISRTLDPLLWSRSSAGTDWSKGRNDSALDPLILVQFLVCHRNRCRPGLQITVSALRCSLLINVWSVKASGNSCWGPLKLRCLLQLVPSGSRTCSWFLLGDLKTYTLHTGWFPCLYWQPSSSHPNSLNSPWTLRRMKVNWEFQASLYGIASSR